MREKLLIGANIALFIGCTLILATVQSSLWFQIFGWFPAPAFWIPALVYIALYRSVTETVLVIFIISLILSTMTVMPDSLLFISLLALGGSIRLVKQRIFWDGSSYIMMVSGFAALVWHIFYWIISMATSTNPPSHPEITDWLIQALLTPLVAPPLDDFFRWLDRLTSRERTAETSADVL